MRISTKNHSYSVEENMIDHTVKFFDDKTEAKIERLSGDFINVPAVPRSVDLILGYDLSNCEVVTIDSAADLRAAVYDTVGICEYRRLLDIANRQSQFCLTPEEEEFKKTQLKSGVNFHKINWPVAIQRKFAGWGQCEQEKRDQPPFQIVISFDGRYPIRDKVPGCFHWWGWEEPLKIDFEELYDRILRDVEAIRQINIFCNEVAK
jgi:hypothetical protein